MSLPVYVVPTQTLRDEVAVLPGGAHLAPLHYHRHWSSLQHLIYEIKITKAGLRKRQPARILDSVNTTNSLLGNTVRFYIKVPKQMQLSYSIVIT